ncbi:Cse1-domain-containing protein [Macrolepiota fuliginosa MF-IS2]|uniref:Cse1-domain-containing protein n=1 Tax=Macrolepiota fuliginosa MF-IS2 TaxID=1400762 RepID=A0A9P5XC26_9AGAR|nr:Cse1-domain-containing protein [Macrolepiota fuliginosa MF-IS2]
MADLPALLVASLKPDTRKQAEHNLTTLSTQPGFLGVLLQLVLEPSQQRPVRLAASIYLKNIAKSRWEEDDQPIPEQDKAALKSQLVPAMLALSNPTDKTIRTQIAEAVSLIAELDFPKKWPDLLDQLVASLSATDYNVNIGVLETAHSIFRPWRAQVRSDPLFTVINFVLSKFMNPFLELVRVTSKYLFTSPPPPNYVQLAQAMVLLIDIFHDLTCQDLPPAIEDDYDEFFGEKGLFFAFLGWDPVELRSDPDDVAPSFPAQVKTGILEIAELFIKLYPDQLQKSRAVEMFVQSVWTLVGANKLPNISDDHLVSQSLRFISTAIHSGYYKPLFSSRETISSLVEGVVVPNVALREHEVEQFEDDPLEYIRMDLALSSTGLESGSRRQAAADVLRSLVSGGFEAETTEMVGTFINGDLNTYQANKEQNWKAKDSAIFMLTAIATKGSTTKHGVTSVNTLIDVVQFFSEHVFQDLQAPDGSVHSILQVDAIRFLHTFRNQLTKPQLLAVLPLLARHLNSSNYVTHTYAAIAIDRILLIKQNNQLIFTQADIREYAAELISIILSKIEAQATPEKVAENDHLMRCAMRIVLTARQSLTPVYQELLGRLVKILGIISNNPSNPNFDQYIFESISGLMRFVVAGSPNSLPTFEQALFGPFTFILQQDIDQYIPYSFQILAQMLELHSTDVPDEYRSLLPFLLTPAIWQQKGSIPGLVKLLKAFLARDITQMLAAGQVASVLAVVQQRLIPSKINDSWGFELLNSVVLHVKPNDLQQYMKPVIMTLLTRMHTSKTTQYEYLFARFIMYTMAVNNDGLGPDYLIAVIEGIQQQLWSQILTSFIVPQAPKVPHKDRKLAVVGMIRLLCQSKYMMQEPFVQAWPRAYQAVVKLFGEPQHLSKKSDEDPHAGITEIDYEEQTAGYQAAYSRLAASEAQEVDPVAYVSNPQQFFQEQLENLQKTYGNQVQALMSTPV